MNDKTYSVIHTIICDDVRKEDNGKEILIGVYNDTLILDPIPAVIPSFAMRFLITTSQQEYTNVGGNIIGPDEKEVLRFGGHIKFENIKYYCSFFFRISPMPFQLAGAYKIHLGLDSSTELVHTFHVITREQDAAK